MRVNANITSTGITTLVPKNTITGIDGINTNTTGVESRINKITISNNSTSNEATVSLQIWDGSSVGYNIIGNMKIPAGVTLVLSDNLNFDRNRFSLRTEVSGTSPILDIIIK